MSKTILAFLLSAFCLLAGCSDASYNEYQTIREEYPNAEIIEEKETLLTTFWVRTENGVVIRVWVDGSRISGTWNPFEDK